MNQEQYDLEAELLRVVTSWCEGLGIVSESPAIQDLKGRIGRVFDRYRSQIQCRRQEEAVGETAPLSSPSFNFTHRF